MEFKYLKEEEIKIVLFSHFCRYQEVTKCFRKVDGKWVIKDIPFIEEWGEKEFNFLVSCLKNTINTGGMVVGAFKLHILK